MQLALLKVRDGEEGKGAGPTLPPDLGHIHTKSEMWEDRSVEAALTNHLRTSP